MPMINETCSNTQRVTGIVHALCVNACAICLLQVKAELQDANLNVINSPFSIPARGTP